MTSLSHPVPSLSRPVAPLTLATVLRTLADWHADRRSRAALARLDDHLLRDIGLDPRGESKPLPPQFSAF